MIFSSDKEKRLGQNPMSLMVNVMERLGIARAHLKIIKTIYKKSVSNIVLGEKLRGAFLVQSRKKTKVFRLSISVQCSP